MRSIGIECNEGRLTVDVVLRQETGHDGFAYAALLSPNKMDSGHLFFSPCLKSESSLGLVSPDYLCT
jgi:hypothetical protein